MLVLPQICDKGKTQSFQDGENTQLCNALRRSPADKGMPATRLCGPHSGGASVQGHPPARLPGRPAGPRGCRGAPALSPCPHQAPASPHAPACVPADAPVANAGKAAPAPPPRPAPLPAWTPGRPRSRGWRSPRPSPPWRASPPPPCLRAEHSLSALGRGNGPPRPRPPRGEARPVLGDEVARGHSRGSSQVRTQGPPAPLGLPAGPDHIQLGDVQELPTDRSPSASEKVHQAGPGLHGACTHLHAPLLPQGRPGRRDGRAVPSGAEDAGGGGAPEGCLLRDAFERGCEGAAVRSLGCCLASPHSPVHAPRVLGLLEGRGVHTPGRGRSSSPQRPRLSRGP